MPKGLDPSCLVRLGEFLDSFAGCFGRRGRRLAASRYVEGLLSEAPRKNMEGIWGRVSDPGDYQSLQHFITHSGWEAERAWERPRRRCPDRRGFLLVDDTGFAKQGRHSVGVQRQYSGTLGKIGNCQVAVSSVLRSKRTTWPLAFDLYLPESWASDRARRTRADVPPDYEFRTKGQIALEQVGKAQEAGIEIECVLADAGYGDSSGFREQIEGRSLFYAVGVSMALTAFAKRPRLLAPQKEREKGRPRTRWRRAKNSPVPQSLGEIARGLPAKERRTLAWRRGTKAALRGRFAALRVWPAHGWQRKPPEKPCWLLIEWRPSQVKYYLSNLPENTSLKNLVRTCKERWAIEQSYREMKQELGLDHFQGRRYRGWQHHAVLTALAFGFLETERRRSRKTPRPTLPALRALTAEILLVQIAAERPRYRAYLAQLLRSPPRRQ